MQKFWDFVKKAGLWAVVFFALSLPLKFLLRNYIYALFDMPPDSDMGIGAIHFFSAMVAFHWISDGRRKGKRE